MSQKPLWIQQHLVGTLLASGFSSCLRIGNMAAAGGKFDAPSPGASVDQGKFLKLAQRVEQTLTKEVLYPEPKQLDPNLVLVSPLNRMGASPNVQHVHYGILKSFLKNSFDRTRPAIGICVGYRSEQGIKKLLEHNRRFTQGNKLLPQILEDHAGPFYGSLACAHLNLAFWAIETGTPSPIGTLGDLMDNKTLKEVVLNGHRWWVLPETVAKESLMDISLWRNQDQNENQHSHELEVLQTIEITVTSFLAAGKDPGASGGPACRSSEAESCEDLATHLDGHGQILHRVPGERCRGPCG